MLPTLYDGEHNHARRVLENICETYDLDVVEPPIPKTIRFAEAPAAAARSSARQGLPGGGRGAGGPVAAQATAQRGRRRAVGERWQAPVGTAPRAWRGVFAVLAAGVTTVAVLGGLGALPSAAPWQAQGVGASADARAALRPGDR